MITTTRCDPEYLRQVAGSPHIQVLKHRAYELLDVQDGSSVLDVGCGPGVDTIPLARRVGPSGYVVGVDADEAMVASGTRAAFAAGVASNTRHVVGTGGALPLGDQTIDACLCDRVLQHVAWSQCRAFAAEIVRVLRPVGRVVLIDTDWGSLSIATEDPELERRVVYEHQLAFRNPYSGRYLPALVRSLPLRDLACEVTALPLSFASAKFLLTPSLRRGVLSGRLPPSAASRFMALLQAAHDYGLWCAHVTMVLVAAERSAR